MRLRLGILTGIAAEAKLIADLDTAEVETIIGRSAADPERARREAARLVDLGAEAILSFGLAGGLSPSLKVGDLVLANEVSLPNGRLFATSAIWREKVMAALAAAAIPTTLGRLHASETIVTEAVEKAALAQLSEAIAVDMESGAAAEAAAQAGLPFLAIRAISDTATTDLPAIATVGFDRNGRVKPLAVARILLTRPGEWPAVFRLARDTRAAFAALSRVIGLGDGGLLP